MVRYILGGILLVSASLSWGEDCQVIAGMWSYHEDRAAEHNEVHDAFGAQCGEWQVYGYRNSNRKDSIFVGREWDIVRPASWLSLGGVTGVISGYEDKPLPAFVPKATIHHGYGDIDILYIPGLVVSAQTKWLIGKRKDPIIYSFPETDYTLGYGYGTMGGQIQIAQRQTNNLAVRVSVGRGKFDWDDWQFNNWVKQEIDFMPNFSGVYLDYTLPFLKEVEVYGGAVLNHSDIMASYSLNPRLNEALTIDVEGLPVPVKEAGSVRVKAAWDKWTWAAGIRIGNPWIKNRKLTMTLDLGMVGLGQPDSSVEIRSPYLLGQPEVVNALSEEASVWLEEQIDEYDLSKYAKAELSVVYRF